MYEGHDRLYQEPARGACRLRPLNKAREAQGADIQDQTYALHVCLNTKMPYEYACTCVRTCMRPATLHRYTIVSSFAGVAFANAQRHAASAKRNVYYKCMCMNTLCCARLLIVTDLRANRASKHTAKRQHTSQTRVATYVYMCVRVRICMHHEHTRTCIYICVFPPAPTKQTHARLHQSLSGRHHASC